MTNIAHAVLAGSDLHEPKGIGSAAINTTYIANGVGSGAWSLIPAAALSPGANPFGGGLMHVREQQASGVGSSTPGTNGVWVTRVLNTTVTNDTGIPTLSANQVTLPAGTYFAQGYAMGDFSTFGTSGVFKGKLFNFTAGSDLLIGSSQAALNQTTSFINERLISNIWGRFTVAVTTAIEMRSWITNGVACSAAGIPATVEIYSEVLFWKVA